MTPPTPPSAEELLNGAGIAWQMAMREPDPSSPDAILRRGESTLLTCTAALVAALDRLTAAHRRLPPATGDCARRCPNEERYDHCGCDAACCYCGKSG